MISHQEEVNYLGKKTPEGKTVDDNMVFELQYRDREGDGQFALGNGRTYTIEEYNIDYHSPKGKSDSKNNLPSRKNAQNGSNYIPNHALEQGKQP